VITTLTPRTITPFVHRLVYLLKVQFNPVNFRFLVILDRAYTGACGNNFAARWRAEACDRVRAAFHRQGTRLATGQVCHPFAILTAPRDDSISAPAVSNHQRVLRWCTDRI
jgi:hypothetical protein